MGISDLMIIYIREPIVGSHSARVGENKATDRICDSRVLFDTPVIEVQVVLHKGFIVECIIFHVKLGPFCYLDDSLIAAPIKLSFDFEFRFE
jgi:hypothetical protein